MTTRTLLLLIANLALTIKFCTPAVPLLVYLVVGYALVLCASRVRDRLDGRAARLVPPAILIAWTATWLLVKPVSPTQQWFARYPSLGLSAFPSIAGASYVFLKVYDLIRRAQRGDAPPGVVSYLTQMTFYPSFLAGPIAGPEPFAHGFAPTRASVADGVHRLLSGVLKLYVLVPLLDQAHVLAPWSGPRPLGELLSRQDLIVGLYGSSLWIFFNFAGYSDLAIGLGLLMGVKLPENFNAPYLAPSPSEFWQRWHVSFTSWLREHVFSPTSRALVGAGLGGSILALVVGTTVTMTFCGLWHRISVEFLVWGLYHAAVVIAHQLFATRVKPLLARTALAGFLRTRAYRALGVVATFHAITLGWALFMPIDAPLGEHLALLRRIFS